MTTERKVAIVMPAQNEWPITQSGGLLEKVLQEVPRDFDPKIFVCANNSEPEFFQKLIDIRHQEKRIQIINLGITKPLGWAYAYLYGLKWAVEDESDFIVEMDANGAHDPGYIREFVDRLDKGAGAALSTRFAKGGGIEKYPLQRRLISKSGTIASNLVLGLGRWVDDMTSGFEAFRRDVLGDVFSTQPIENWVSVTRGPGHFYQTEMRARVIWRGHDISMVPIVWGSESVQDADLIPLRTVLKAFHSLMILRSQKRQLVK